MEDRAHELTGGILLTPYHDAILKCADRYRTMQLNYPYHDPELLDFTYELMQGCRDGLPVPKLCRWLGYIQGLLIERGFTTVTKERDWTRPLFRPLDFA